MSDLDINIGEWRLRGRKRRRPPRVEIEMFIYDRCARGDARQAIFHNKSDRAGFIEILSQSAQRFETAILCSVLALAADMRL